MSWTLSQNFAFFRVSKKHFASCYGNTFNYWVEICDVDPLYKSAVKDRCCRLRLLMLLLHLGQEQTLTTHLLYGRSCTRPGYTDGRTRFLASSSSDSCRETVISHVDQRWTSDRMPVCAEEWGNMWGDFKDVWNFLVYRELRWTLFPQRNCLDRGLRGEQFLVVFSHCISPLAILLGNIWGILNF